MQLAYDKGNRFKLPSGAVVDIDRPDFSLCKDADDFMELKYALSEKIIDIELQIDLFTATPDEDATADWLPRAKAALKWTKLYRDEAQNRQGRATNIEKARRHNEAEQCVVDVLRKLLPEDKFLALMEAGRALAEKRAEDFKP